MKIVEWLLKWILFALLIVGLLITSPLLILKYIVDSIYNNKLEKHYPKFLKSIDEKKFFVHTDRHNSKEYIRFTLQPLLPQDIVVTTIIGEIFADELDADSFSRMLYSVSPTTYPVLIKVVNSRVLKLEINNEFYNIMHQNKDINVLVEKIKNF
jgi:hypothetical protein